MKRIVAQVGVLGLVAAGLLTQPAFAANTWTGTTNSDWNNITNWGGAFPAAGDVYVNNTANPGVFPIIDSDSAFALTARLDVGTGGATGQIDHRAGAVSTGGDLFLAYQAGTATYNLADTSGTGGTFTGMATGSGSLTTKNIMATLDNGSTSTININTTGTLTSQGTLYLGSSGNNTATLNLDNGTLNVTGDLQVGGRRWSDGTGTYALNMSGGTISVGGQFFTARNGTGTTTQTGGDVTAGTYFVVGLANGSVGTYNLSGGTATQNGTGQITTIGAAGGSQGTMNVSGGTYTSRGDLVVGESGTGTLNISGSGTVVSADNKWTVVAKNAGSTGTINLDGGTFNVRHIQQGAGNPGNIYLNGGTLQVNTASDTLISGVATYVKAGGAVVDTAGFDKTMGVALLEDSVSTGGGLTKLGDGTLTLGNANTYTGDTDVNAGGLNLTGSVAGNVNVASGAAIGGNGSIAGNLSLASGALLAFSTNNTLSVLGTLSLDNSFGVASLGVTDWSTVVDGTYVLINATGDFSNIQNFGAANAYDIDGTRSAYFQNGSLELVVIPEPATIGMIGFVGIGMLFVRRRLMM